MLAIKYSILIIAIMVIKSDGSLSENTNRVYKKSFEMFLEISGLSKSELKGIPASELRKMIDQTFSNLADISQTTKLVRISGCRNYIEKNYDIELPKSRDSKTLAKKKLRTSNKMDLDESQVKDIIEYFNNERLKANSNKRKISALRNYLIVNLLAFTGQRIGDLLELKVSHAVRNEIKFKQEKTGNEVSIPNPIQSEILFYVSTQKLRQSDFLFRNGMDESEVLSYNFVLGIIKKAGMMLFGLDTLTPHVFRKYAVTHLKSLNLSDAEVMAVTGHADIRMLGYYTGKGEAPANLKILLLQGKEK